MNSKNVFRPVLALMLIAFLQIGCAGILATPAATSTPATIPTLTPIPSTFTPTPTLTPTNTPIPPTSTSTPIPAALGEAVSYGSIEITVLDVYKHDKIVPGGTYYYTPNPGYMVIDLVVKIKNLGTAPASITWEDLHVMEEDGAISNTEFAGFTMAGNSEKVNPLSIQYDSTNFHSLPDFSNTIYLRVIFIIKDKPEQTVLFGIKDSPLIQLTIKK
jgi:hypothetical protein